MNGLKRPRLANSTHYSSEQFPEVVAFCDRDDTTHVVSGDEESFEYKLNYLTLYLLKRKGKRWEVIEFDNHRIIRVSMGASLGVALFQALTFRDADKIRQSVRCNVLFPVTLQTREKALAIMYYLGGYPGSFLPVTAELALIKEKFVDPEIDFLAYSYVPCDYVDWLREELKAAGVWGEGKNRSVWMYRK